MNCPLCGYLKCRCLEVEAVQKGRAGGVWATSPFPPWMKPALARRLIEERTRLHPEAKQTPTDGLTRTD